MKRETFKKLCALLWGEHGWQSEAARNLGRGLRTIVRYNGGESPNIPDDVADNLRKIAVKRGREIIKAAGEK
jgi:hypothetical protein